jgi:hypothetical protein
MSAPRRVAARHSRQLSEGVPRIRIHIQTASPAMVNRMPAIKNGGISSTPTRIARYVDPQTK